MVTESRAHKGIHFDSYPSYSAYLTYLTYGILHMSCARARVYQAPVVGVTNTLKVTKYTSPKSYHPPLNLVGIKNPR